MLRRAYTPRACTRALSSRIPACIEAKKFKTPLNVKKINGVEILNDPLWNKGTAFSTMERDRLGLKGLLPPVVKTIEEQADQFLDRMRAIEDPIDKNLLLRALHDRNETLFHRVLVDCIEEVAPLVYTPTVGQVCQKFSRTFTRARGLTFTPDDRGSMGIIMENWPATNCQVACVTDGSRILGLGDLGANGMGIPIGKLALYCAYGGIAPHRVLPITLDFGTDNEELLNDPSYTVGLSRFPRGENHAISCFHVCARPMPPHVLRLSRLTRPRRTFTCCVSMHAHITGLPCQAAHR